MRALHAPRGAIAAVVVAIIAVIATVDVMSLVQRVVQTSSRTSNLVWSDDFTGPVGTSARASGWTAEPGYFGAPYRSLECMTTSTRNSALDGAGHLLLTARHDVGTQCGATTTDYTSARLTSRHSQPMKYGYLEVRAKMAAGAGMWNALWLLGSNYPQVGYPACGEIDIAEVLAKNPHAIYSSVHGPDAAGKHFLTGGQRITSDDLGRTFHRYAMEWSANRIRFALDDFVYLTLTRSQVEAKGRWVFDHDFDIILSLTVGGLWAGAPAADSAVPRSLAIDYVRLWRTPPT